MSRLEPSAEGTICDWDNSTDTGVAVPKKVRQSLNLITRHNMRKDQQFVG